MTTKARIIAIRLAENIARQREYAHCIGVVVELAKKNPVQNKKELMEDYQ